MEWNEANIERLRKLWATGIYTYNVMAVILGVSCGAVSGAIYRYIHRNPPRRPKPKLPTGSRNPQRNPNTHTLLVEPWAEYTARKKAERAAAKLALSEVTPTVRVSRES